ncbi:MAG: KUP/HAK/KT family potassium transporter [Gemmatimonadaceae bacterium]
MSQTMPNESETVSTEDSSEPPSASKPTKAETAVKLTSNTAMFAAATPLHSLPHDEHPRGKRLAILTLTALGVVYGDIGTSPLYSIKECFSSAYGLQPTPENVYGVLSLIVWALTLVVSVKYISFVLRADNRGEGGTFALLALIFPKRSPDQKGSRGKILVMLALFGTALLYGDGIITPAMSVLGALEGVQVALPSLAHFIVPVALIILAALFMVQRFGTDFMGKAFGPIMLLWFGSIAALGLNEIIQAPRILTAVNPMYAWNFFHHHGTLAFFVLGSVVLVITGGEALYADMGHFGKRPIRVAWLALVFPALLLNYFGQGALIVSTPTAAANPFYLLAPKAMLWPLLVLATLAAIVASQAMISGAFSVTRSGIQLGYIPRLEVRHTSKTEQGQIYIPEVNRFIMVGCLVIAFWFKDTAHLGAAYGIAVTGTMFITSILFYYVARLRFRWSQWKASALVAGFLIVDGAFLSANLVKVAHGGWVPLLLGVVLFMLMMTWKRGRALLNARLADGTMPIELFLSSFVEHENVHRVKGTAVFMTGNDNGVPPVLLHHLKHNKVLHERVLLFSVKTAEVPETSGSERVRLIPLGQGFWRVIATYGFMQSPNVPEILEVVDKMGVRCKQMETSYYMGRERLIPTKGRPEDPFKLTRWRKKIFSFLARNARSATEFYGIPPNRVVELGTQIEF